MDKATGMALAEGEMRDAARELVHSGDADRQHPGGETKRTLKAGAALRRAAIKYVRAMDAYTEES